MSLVSTLVPDSAAAHEFCICAVISPVAAIARNSTSAPSADSRISSMLRCTSPPIAFSAAMPTAAIPAALPSAPSTPAAFDPAGASVRNAVCRSVAVVYAFNRPPAARPPAATSPVRPTTASSTGVGTCPMASTRLVAPCARLRSASLAPDPLWMRTESNAPPSFSRSPRRLSCLVAAVSAA